MVVSSEIYHGVPRHPGFKLHLMDRVIFGTFKAIECVRNHEEFNKAETFYVQMNLSLRKRFKLPWKEIKGVVISESLMKQPDKAVHRIAIRLRTRPKNQIPALVSDTPMIDVESLNHSAVGKKHEPEHQEKNEKNLIPKNKIK